MEVKSVFKKKNKTKKGSQKGLYLLENTISTEQIRIIRNNLVNESKNNPRVIMITTPSEREENTVISSKLAISFVEQGKRVLLVDANVRNPSLHQTFSINNESGLTNVLFDDENVHLYIRETFISGLSLLPAGSITSSSSKIWITSKIQELINKCDTDFDYVIFVAPPFLTVSDSHTLASQCDGVILVIKENKTKKKDILQTKYSVERTNNRLLGVIYQTG